MLQIERQTKCGSTAVEREICGSAAFDEREIYSAAADEREICAEGREGVTGGAKRNNFCLRHPPLLPT